MLAALFLYPQMVAVIRNIWSKFKGARKPRRRGKKIRFESLGLDKKEMEQIQMAADLSKKRKATGGDAKDFEDFDPFESKNMEEDEVPSMWDYNPSCLPREFRDMDPDSYLVNPNQFNVCQLPKEVLVRICSMLTPMEFADLSSTCRFLHWRMYTFTTCYAPYTARLEIIDEELTKGLEKYQVAPKILHYKDGQQRGIFILQPSCLKKPFFFDTLELSMEMNTKIYPQVLKHILPMRKFANRLELIHYKEKTRSVCADALVDTMQQMNVNSFRFWIDDDSPKPSLIHNFFVGIEAQITSALWDKIEYFRQMEEFCVTNALAHISHDLSLTNRFGIYVNPCMKNTCEVLQKFAENDTSIDFHVYVYFYYEHPMVLCMATIMAQDDAPELYSDRYGHLWMSARGEFLLKLYKQDGVAVVMIGREKTFYKNQRQYRRICRRSETDPAEDDSDRDEQFDDSCDDDLRGDYWTMKTAIEGTERKKSKKIKRH